MNIRLQPTHRIAPFDVLRAAPVRGYLRFVLRGLAVGSLFCSLVLMAGCHKKRPVIVPPPQAQAPPVIPTPQLPPPPPVPQPSPVPEKVVPPKSNHKRRRLVRETKKAAETPSVSASNPGATKTSGEISVGMDDAQAAHDRQLTTQLLQSTDENLKKLNRALTPDETAMLQQIRAYMEQSRAALQDGDLGRASNLALKAHLLSDALIK